MAPDVDLLTVAIAALAILVVVAIVRAVRATNATIAAASRRVNLDDEAVARSVVDRLRERDVRCPRCGGETIALIGTSRRYRCEDCGAAFDGAPHVPDPARQR